jgi:hypothetical protein
MRQIALFPDVIPPAPAAPGLPEKERYCRACGSLDVTIGPGKGPHHARCDCRECGETTWISKTRRHIVEEARLGQRH